MEQIIEKQDGNNKPGVAIILVNYNGFKDTVECVESLCKVDYPNYRIVVVDNGSNRKPDKSQIKYLRKYTHYISLNKNLGFSGGNNVGVQWALNNGYQYVLLLNNDTTVNPQFLNVLIHTAESQEKVGIVGGKILFYQPPHRIWFGGGMLNKKYGNGSHERYNQINTADTGNTRRVTFLTGCLMLIPRNVIFDVGLLDEKYFLYAEDTDYCCRVMNKGYNLWFCDSSLIYHKVSASTGEGSARTQYYMIRNSLYLSRKYFEHYRLVHLRLFFRTLKDVIRGRKQVKPVMIAIVHYFKGVKGMGPF